MQNGIEVAKMFQVMEQVYIFATSAWQPKYL